MSAPGRLLLRPLINGPQFADQNVKKMKCHSSAMQKNRIRGRERCLGSMAEHNLEQTVTLLTRTPTAFNALVRDLPEEWTQRSEGEKSWSVFEVVGHLVYAERVDWIPRAKVILESGERRAFEPFDRLGHVEEIQGKSLGQLLDEFARLRKENLHELRGLHLRSEDRIGVASILLWVRSLFRSCWHLGST